MVVLLDAYIVLYCLYVSVSFNRMFLFFRGFFNLSGVGCFWWFSVFCGCCFLMVFFFLFDAVLLVVGSFVFLGS